MRLLVLGGTEFVGRAVADAALARGWEVTVFHRGRHAPPEGAAVLRGDRTAPDGLTGLDGAGPWDAAVDTWPGAPAAVLASAGALRGRVGRYVYVSSRSVYAPPVAPGLPEDGPVVDAAPDDDGAADYARAKRGGELAAEQVFGSRALLARPGLILGPGENIGRLPWWLGRIARGGPVPAPGPRDAALQYVDVRDLARWLLEAADAGLGGAYNTVSPCGHTTMGALLEACVSATGADARLRWVEPDAVLAAGVEPWTELPVWLPPGESYDALHCGDVSKAVAAGLRCRPVSETVADTWTWLRRLGGAAPLRAGAAPVGLPPEKDAALLAADD